MEIVRKIQNSSYSGTTLPRGSFNMLKLLRNSPRHVRSVLERMVLRNNQFHESGYLDVHHYSLMDLKAKYVPLLGYLIEDGYSQAQRTRFNQPRQTGKSETVMRLMELALHRQILWRVLAIQPTDFSMDYI